MNEKLCYTHIYVLLEDASINFKRFSKRFQTQKKIKNIALDNKWPVRKAMSFLGFILIVTIK